MLFTLSAMLLGCSSPSITDSRRLEGYTGRVNDLLIVYFSNKLGTYEGVVKKREARDLVLPFQKAGINANFLLMTSLDLDSKKKLASYRRKRTSLLSIDPIHMTEAGDRVIGIVYNLKLYDGFGRTVWAANLRLPSLFSGFEEMGGAILERLQADDLIKRTSKKK